MDEGREQIRLIHLGSGRAIPLEKPTVVGRKPEFHDYRKAGDQRLHAVADQLARNDFVLLCNDEQASRNHALIDPAKGTIYDLNSKNGTLLDRLKLASRVDGGLAPGFPLKNGAQLQIGRERFRVEARYSNLQSICEGLAPSRHAIVIGEHPLVSSALRGVLERKNFSVRTGARQEDHSLWVHLSNCAREDGVVVVALLDGQLTSGSLRFLRTLPGRKVIALQSEHDPAAQEALFADVASRDMVLLTSVGAVDLDHGLLDGMCTAPRKQVADSIGGRGIPGVCDDLVDGLEALIHLDTNTLDADWIHGYRGRLGVVVGRLTPLDQVVEHDIGTAQTSWRVRGSRRSRQVSPDEVTSPGTARPDYALPGTARPSYAPPPEDSPLQPSWQMR